MNRFVPLAMLAIALSSTACAPSATKPDALPAAGALPEFKLGVDDLVEIAVWRNDGLGRTVPVRPDGMISLPLINDVRAAGLTPMELRQALTQKFSTFVQGPEVSVIVREVHSVRVSVLGQVAHPGLYELRGPTTLLDVLAHAGGVTPFASRSKIVLLRSHAGQGQRYVIDEDDALAQDGAANLVLQGGDTVFVP